MPVEWAKISVNFINLHNPLKCGEVGLHVITLSKLSKFHRLHIGTSPHHSQCCTLRDKAFQIIHLSTHLLNELLFFLHLATVILRQPAHASLGKMKHFKHHVGYETLNVRNETLHVRNETSICACAQCFARYSKMPTGVKLRVYI